MTRTRSDLCPGVFRPWPARDGSLVRLRVPGGQVSRDSLAALVAISEEYGDGRVHLTKRANLQLRALPTPLPSSFVDAVQAAGLLPHPSHELVRNVLASPLTGLSGGRADLRPVLAALDEALCSTPSLANLPGRFLFVLDDGRGDVLDRPLDLGLVAVSATDAQLRLGSRAWGPVVPLAEAAARLAGLAAAFLRVRGDGPTAPWHVDELPSTFDSSPRDPRTVVSSGPARTGIVADGVHVVDVPDGLVDGAVLDGLAGERLVVTPWRSLVVHEV